MLIRFNTDNNAFHEGDDNSNYNSAFITECTRILIDITEKIQSGVVERMPILDLNGNKIGYFDIEEE